MATGQPNAEIIADCAPTLNCNHEQPIIFQSRAGAASTMPASEQPPTLYGGHGVRRITPVEAERLQGFPDNYTKINDKTADGPRYKALGNSMAVPVMRWIGERINNHK